MANETDPGRLRYGEPKGLLKFGNPPSRAKRAKVVKDAVVLSDEWQHKFSGYCDGSVGATVVTVTAMGRLTIRPRMRTTGRRPRVVPRMLAT